MMQWLRRFWEGAAGVLGQQVAESVLDRFARLLAYIGAGGIFSASQSPKVQEGLVQNLDTLVPAPPGSLPDILMDAMVYSIPVAAGASIAAAATFRVRLLAAQPAISMHEGPTLRSWARRLELLAFAVTVAYYFAHPMRMYSHETLLTLAQTSAGIGEVAGAVALGLLFLLAVHLLCFALAFFVVPPAFRIIAAPLAPFRALFRRLSQVA